MVATAGAAALVAAARHAPPFREVSDGAIIEIYTLEALRGKLLVGPYSRFGWHHPGPIFFYLLAPWYRLSGLHTAGAQAGALVVNVAAVAVMAAALLRAASTALTIITCGAVAGYMIRVGDMLVSVWNPHAIVLPFIAFLVVAAASAAASDRALILWLTVLGSFLVQTHLAMAPVVAAVSICVVVAARGVIRRVWLPLVVAVIVLWLPVAIEQATHRPGNLTRIFSFFVSGGDGPRVQPLATAVRAWASVLTAVFRDDFAVAMGFDYAPAVGSVAIIASVTLVGLLAAAAFVARRRDRFAFWLAGLCGIVTLIALAATTRIRGQIVDHEIFWMSGLGVLDVAAIISALAAPFGDSRRPIRRPATAITVVVAFIVGATGMSHVLHRERGIDDHNVDVIVDAMIEDIRTLRAQRLLVTIDPVMWPLAAGALLQLDKAGVSWAVDDRWATMFGERFARTGREDAEVRITGSPVQPEVVRTR